MSNRSPLINVMARAAIKAGKSLRRDFGEVENIQFSHHGTQKFVRSSKNNALRTLEEILQQSRDDFEHYPTDATEFPAEKYFVYNAICGCDNFSRGFPYFGIAIYAKNASKTEAAVIYDPINDYFFWAEDHFGAYMNDQRLRVTQRDEQAEKMYALSLNMSDKNSASLSQDIIKKITERQLIEKNISFQVNLCSELDIAFAAKAHIDTLVIVNPTLYEQKLCTLFISESAGHTIIHKDKDKNLLLVGGNMITATELEKILKKQ